MNYKRIVPNTISGISLVLGVISIFYTIDKEFSMAAICIILSVVADSLDGRAARLLGVSGPFGVEMDSLCDLGAFGVAPAILIYEFGLTEFLWWGKIIAGIYCFMGAMRLARFNVNSSVVHGYFQGMPIPAGACVIATYVLSGFNFPQVFTAGLTFATAVILYSNVKFPDFKGHGNPMYKLPVVLAVLIGLALLYERPAGWPFVCMFTYFIAGVINGFYALLFMKQQKGE